MKSITFEYPRCSDGNVSREDLYYDENLDLNVHVFVWDDTRDIPFKEGDIIEATFISDDEDENLYNHKIIKIEGNKIYSAEFYNGKWYRYKMEKKQ